MKIGVNIATWSFDRDSFVRKDQYAMLEVVYPDKHARFLQSGYTHSAFFPWYPKSHEEEVLGELKERGWKLMWCLVNDNPIFAGTALTSSGRRKRIVEALSLEDGLSKGSWGAHNLLLTEVSCEAHRLEKYIDAFELVNADIDISTIDVQALSLAVQKSGVSRDKVLVQGAFLYDYRRKPKSDVRLTGYSKEGVDVVSEFGVEASVDKEDLKERMIWVLGALWSLGCETVYHHEYVSRAWGWDTWRTPEGTKVLWANEEYRSFLAKKAADEAAPHSRYVTVLRPSIIESIFIESIWRTQEACLLFTR